MFPKLTISTSCKRIVNHVSDHRQEKRFAGYPDRIGGHMCNTAIYSMNFAQWCLRHRPTKLRFKPMIYQSCCARDKPTAQADWPVVSCLDGLRKAARRRFRRRCSETNRCRSTQRCTTPSTELCILRVIVTALWAFHIRYSVHDPA